MAKVIMNLIFNIRDENLLKKRVTAREDSAHLERRSATCVQASERGVEKPSHFHV